MQQRKNRRRFILLALLTAITLLVLWWIQPENRLAIREDIFSVEDLNTIDKVELETDSSRVVLAFKNNGWRVNDRYAADGSMIRVLFATLQQAVPKRAVARAHEDSLFRFLAREGVKVSLFAGEDVRKQFFAGGNRTKTQAYFANPETSEVYVMAIPGYRVYVSGILELDESGWRDKIVFGFNWENFKSLEAEFPDRPDENFKVSMRRDFFGIEGQPNADTARLNSFLDEVSLLTVSAYVDKPGLRDSLQKEEPQLEFKVTDVGNRVYRLRLFGSSDDEGEVYGIIQDSQLALFDRRIFRNLYRPKSFFTKK